MKKTAMGSEMCIRDRRYAAIQRIDEDALTDAIIALASE